MVITVDTRPAAVFPEKDKLLKLLFMFEYQQGTCRSVSAETGWGKTKVSEVYSKCREAGMKYEDAKEMSGQDIARILKMAPPGNPAMKDVPDHYWEWVCRELHKNKRKTLNYIWTEHYSKDYPDGLGYSQFCRRYSSWVDKARKEIILPQERVPGREIFIDWVGDTISMMDKGSAYMRNVYFFISTIGDSSYPFVEAFTGMDQAKWVQAHIDMLDFYGGVPRLFVPDNTRTAVTVASLYDPCLNHAYRDMAVHYGVGIAPARVRAPQDKPTVEAGVQWVEKWLITWLEDKPAVYQDITELNNAIRMRMEELVQRKFKNRAGSRKSVFESLDKPELRPLPRDGFLFFTTLTKKSLPLNWHFDVKEGLDTFYYSFPYIYAGQEGYAHVYPKKVEIYVTTVGRVAVHNRRFTGRRYVTEITHAPANQQERMRYNGRTGSYYRAKAEKIGKSTSLVISAILENGPVEEQGYRSCDGILRMVEKYGTSELEDACRRALEVGRPNYTTIKAFIGKAAKPADISAAMPGERDHENLRKGWR